MINAAEALAVAKPIIDLKEAEHQAALERWFEPHRNGIEAAIITAANEGKINVTFQVHSELHSTAARWLCKLGYSLTSTFNQQGYAIIISWS